jgi:diphthine synthase
MVLYVIGLGLGDEKDITVKGLEAVKRSSKVFLEQYTSVLGVDKEKLEQFYGKEITIADRDCVEIDAESIYMSAKDEDVSFLVVGDAFW